MKKPGAAFGFRPTNNITSSETSDFPESPKKLHRTKTGLDRSCSDLVRPTTFASDRQTPRSVPPFNMARSRTTSFSDDDLQFISSQMASEAAQSQQSNSQQTSPGRPTNGNRDVIDITSSPAPEFGKTTVMSSQPAPKMFSSLYKKEKKSNVFYQPRNRVEHHRVNVPSAPRYNDTMAAPVPTYSSLPPVPRDSRSSGPSMYGQTAGLGDEVFYTDPKKAGDDLKALLEGGMDDEEDDEKKEEADVEEEIDDGTLEGINVKLLPHQQEGVEWMKGRELGPVKRGKVPKGGILADDMGLGKTLQSISLIISSPKPKKEDKGWKKHYDGVGKGTLVVAPLALIRQWEAEIAEKVARTHRLNVCVHHGPNRTKRFADLAKYDVVITTYQILVSEHGHTTDDVSAGCFGIHWYRVILDEAHTIKNRNAKATKACYALRSEFRWCLTGTPMQNNLDELQSLVKFLRIGPYDDLQHWREYIDKPMKGGKGHVAIKRLHSLLRCFMKRRTKEILKEEGALNPGGKKALQAAAAKGDGKLPNAPAFKVTERKVVTVTAEFSEAERRFYNRLEERAEESLQKMAGKVNYANALVLLLRLRQACNHPKLVGINMEKDKDALSMDTVPQPAKTADADVDALADLFGGIDIQSKQCDVCMSDLSKEEANGGLAVCGACEQDRAEFNTENPARMKSKKKASKKVVRESIKIEPKKRKPRHRPAVIDSDDEEDDGSWIVGEDNRGALRLGKAGGEEDENCEGGGESINSEDSIHHSEDEDDGSRLDSFIVDDEKENKRKARARRTVDSDSEDDEDDDESLVSVSKLCSKVSEKNNSSQESGSDSESASDSEVDSGVNESEYESADDAFSRNDRHGRVVPSAKIRQLLEILHKEVHEHKFIVFSQFTSMLDLVAPFFDRDGFKYTRYEGSMRNDQREESLHSLRNDPETRILLCSLKCGSLGLNLTAATRVVILEPFWNPFVEEQAIDRVHRLTQTIDVIVYKITVGKSVEERILELQNKKRLLAAQAIEGGMKKGDLRLGLREMLALFNRDRTSGVEDRVDVDGEYSPVDAPRGGGVLGRKRETGSREPSQFSRRW